MCLSGAVGVNANPLDSNNFSAVDLMLKKAFKINAFLFALIYQELLRLRHVIADILPAGDVNKIMLSQFNIELV